MQKLILLRHGESDWNRENRFTGWTDVDLSERGIQEARRADAGMGLLLRSSAGACQGAAVEAEDCMMKSRG